MFQKIIYVKIRLLLCMKKLILFIFLAFCVHFIHAQDFPFKIYKGFDSFEKEVLQSHNDTTYVVNFWATWCAPCVKELPYFEEVTERMNDEKVKVILVSLDFPKHYQKKLVPFIKKHDLKSEVVVLDDSRPNDWIDKVDPSWSGAIPITVFYQDQDRKFYEREFHNYQELKSIIESFNR